MFYTWGANSYGQLGLGYVSEQEVTPRQVPVTQKFVKIAGGGGHTLAVDNEGGTLFVCGWNRFGQLGLGHCTDVNSFTRTEISDVTDISGGWDFSLVLRNNGTVLAAGSNKFLQLGKE